MKKLLLLLLLLLPTISQAVYDIPNNDGDCPGNCRQIPWLAGSDIWNSGTLPTYTGIPCTSGLTEGDGTTDNTSAIQACLDALSTNEAAVLPAGIYYVNGTIRLLDNTVLRGQGRGSIHLPTANAAVTTLKLGTSGLLRLGADSNADNAPKGAAKTLSSGYTKGSTEVVAQSSHGINTNDWVVIYEQPDSEVPVTNVGEYGNCTYCGEQNNEGRLMSQIVQVTNVSTNTLTLSRPLYYTFKSALSPGIRTYNYDYANGDDKAVKYAGIEDMRVNGWSASKNTPQINMTFSLFNWVKNVELYNDYDSAKAFHIYAEWAYGNEIRDNYIHKMRATGSDRAYGIALFFTTSDNKIENNTLRDLRHAMVQEGGGSGNVYLYNYWDDLYVQVQINWMDGQRLSHGAHPYMTLVEGNIGNLLGVDVAFGSSSHGTFFRNWGWGDLTGDFTGYDATHPQYYFSTVRLDRRQNYYNFVGNVLGNTGLHTDWSSATFHPTTFVDQSTYGTRAAPVVWLVGYDDNGSPYDSDSWTSLIKHGNYDYLNEGVNDWDGGADHDLKDSMYPPYATNGEPDWWQDTSDSGKCRPWPSIGSDLSPLTVDIPAKDQYEGETYSGVSCTGVDDNPTRKRRARRRNFSGGFSE